MFNTLLIIYTILISLTGGWYIRKYKRKKKKLDLTINRIKDAVISLDTKGRYIFLNDAALETHPLGREKTLGKVIWDVHPKMEGSAFWEAYHKAVETGGMVEVESYYTAMDKWFSVKIYPSDSGATIFYLDITDSKLFSLQLGNSEEKYRTLFYKSPLPAWLYDFETLQFIDVNEAAILHYGYTRDEFLAMTIKDIRPEEDITSLLKEIAEVKSTNSEGTINSSWRHIKRNGDVIFVEATAHSFEHEGRTVRIVIVNDITEKTIMQRKLLENQMKLNEAQAIGHLGYWDVDLQTNTHTWSQELYKIFGLDSNLAKPSVSLFLSLIYQEDREIAETLIKRALYDHKDAKRDFRYVTTSGIKRYGYIEWKFEYTNNIATRLFGIVQDITSRKEAEESAKLLESEIKEHKIQQQKKISKAIIKAQEKQKNYIARELHDNINQILYGARFHLGAVGRKNELVKEVIKEPAEQIGKAMEEIHLLCQNLVSPLTNVNLEDIINDLILKLNCDEDTALNINFSYSAPIEFSDEIKLNIYRIIQEQLHNIFKYAKAKNVNIALKLCEGCICVTVEDDGIGFDVKENRKGFGISNIMHRAEAFNGKVKIKSRIGEGTRTEVILPFNLVAEAGDEVYMD
jgi:PAS domain S-box-containing protein